MSSCRDSDLIFPSLFYYMLINSLNFLFFSFAFIADLLVSYNTFVRVGMVIVALMTVPQDQSVF